MVNSCLHFITAVWGEGHTRLFLEVGLPSLLSPENIPGMSCRTQSMYHIFTHQKDFQKIESSPSYQYLKTVIPTKVTFIEEKIENPHLMMSHCHRLGLEESNRSNMGTVFIPPDCIWSKGSMVNLEKILAKNVSMVHMSGLRVQSEEMKKKCGVWLNQDKSILEVGARELIKFGIQYLHPITNDLFFREKSEKLMPANLLWTVENEGILARCFHLHPLYVAPNKKSVDFQTTIDDDLGLLFDPQNYAHYVVSDSDEIFAFELSSISHKVTATYEKASVSDVAAWAEVGINKMHRQLVKTTIKIHHGDMNNENWKPLEKEADGVIAQAMTLVDSSLVYLFLHGHVKNVQHRSYACSFKEPCLKNLNITSFISLCDILIIKILLTWVQINKIPIIVKYRNFIRWKLYSSRHHAKYYFSRICFYFNWYKHRVLHQLKYYWGRVFFSLK